jgi:hypothetical protein
VILVELQTALLPLIVADGWLRLGAKESGTPNQTDGYGTRAPVDHDCELARMPTRLSHVPRSVCDCSSEAAEDRVYAVWTIALCRSSHWIACSRSLNFWTLPLIVIGNSSTGITYRGTL